MRVFKKNRSREKQQNIPNPIQAKLVIPIPQKENNEVDQIIKDVTNTILKEPNKPGDNKKKLVEFPKAGNFIKNIGINEDIYISGHGSLPSSYIEESEMSSFDRYTSFLDQLLGEDEPQIQGYTAQTIFNFLVENRLPKNYNGTIHLISCNLGKKGVKNQRSFLEFFAEGMKRNGYHKTSIIAPMGTIAYHTRDSNPFKKHELFVGLKEKKVIDTFIKDTRLNRRRNTDPTTEEQTNTFYQHQANGTKKLFGFAEYRNGSYSIPGAHRDFNYYDNNTNELNEAFKMEEGEDDFEFITANKSKLRSDDSISSRAKERDGFSIVEQTNVPSHSELMLQSASSNEQAKPKSFGSKLKKLKFW